MPLSPLTLRLAQSLQTDLRTVNAVAMHSNMRATAARSLNDLHATTGRSLNDLHVATESVRRQMRLMKTGSVRAQLFRLSDAPAYSNQGKTVIQHPLNNFLELVRQAAANLQHLPHR
jgi:hypothetical protein